MCIAWSLSSLHAHRPVGFPDAVAEVDGGRRLLAHEDRVVALQAAVLRRGRDGQSHAHEQRRNLKTRDILCWALRHGFTGLQEMHSYSFLADLSACTVE